MLISSFLLLLWKKSIAMLTLTNVYKFFWIHSISAYFDHSFNCKKGVWQMVLNIDCNHIVILSRLLISQKIIDKCGQCSLNCNHIQLKNHDIWTVGCGNNDRRMCLGLKKRDGPVRFPFKRSTWITLVASMIEGDAESYAFVPQMGGTNGGLNR